MSCSELALYLSGLSESSATSYTSRLVRVPSIAGDESPWVVDMSKAEDLVGELKKLTQGADRADLGIAQQLAVFGELLVVLGKDLGKAQRTIARLTVVIAVLTTLLLVFTGILTTEAVVRWTETD